MNKDKLKSIMVTVDATIKEAMQKLNETAEKILFVVEKENRLAGVVTDGDIRRGIISDYQLTTPLSKIMKTNFISIESGCHELHKKAKELMQKNRIEKIPVVNKEGFLEDVIAWIDLLEGGRQSIEGSLLPNQVVIMAGGRGTRLDPFTKILPKALIPLGEKPIIEHIMDRFFKSGFHRFLLLVNYKKEMMKMYFRENRLPYNIELAEEDNYLGTAGGLSLVRELITETFILTNCDTILEVDYTDIMKWHKQRRCLITVIGLHKEITVPYGVITMNNGKPVTIDEKPKYDLFVNTGAYVLEPDVFKFIGDDEAIDMDKLISRINETHYEEIGIYPYWGKWFDVGQWDEYRRSLRYLDGEGKNV